MKKHIYNFVKYSTLGLVLASTNLYAAGYKMEFQSPSILADAGEAAAVNDAGTNWYNSAGLVYLPQQAVFSVIEVYGPTTFSGTVIGPSGLPSGIPGANFTGSGTASSHPSSALPAIHYTYPFMDRLSAGVSIVPAWGFMEDYGENSLVRYDLTRVYTKTIDIAPSLAFKINDQWSIGIGPDAHYFSVESRAKVFTAPLGTRTDSSTRFSANNWAYGGHIGILFRLDEATRIGLNYRSKLVMDLNGYDDFTLSGVGVIDSRNFKLRVPLPATTTLSVYHAFNPCFALLGTLAYDQWSVLNTYRANNYATPLAIIPTVLLPQNMRDTLDISIGTHYKLNNQWLLRGSLKYLPTPTSDQYRDINFPDGEKLGVNIGARYQMTKQFALDLIYGHVFVKTVKIHGLYPQQVFPNTVAANGHSRSSIDLLGASLVWNI